jgi:uncharacterized oxidoreductase
LVSGWIPALDGVEAKLQSGARVADVGCGHGASTILMAEAYPRSEFVGFDYHPASIEHARDAVLAAHPDLDTVVTMSGVMLPEDLRDPGHIAAAETTVATNLLGTIRLVDAFTPHLLARGAGTIVTVTSGIAFLPFPLLATYAASKAGVHAYSEALRAQLAGTGVDVVELVPPAVATTPEISATNPAALPLDAYVRETLELLAADPTPHEVLVEGVRMHRWAEKNGTYDELVAQRSRALDSLPGRGQ